MQFSDIHKIGDIQSIAVNKHTAKAARGNAAASPASPASGSTMITSNDFLTLLVAEMKNQDPTATVDPNAYINQLVGVNSLQQLIQINSDLGGSSATAVGRAQAGTSSAIANALSQNYGAASHKSAATPAVSPSATSRKVR